MVHLRVVVIINYIRLGRLRRRVRGGGVEMVGFYFGAAFVHCYSARLDTTNVKARHACYCIPLRSAKIIMKSTAVTLYQLLVLVLELLP